MTSVKILFLSILLLVFSKVGAATKSEVLLKKTSNASVAYQAGDYSGLVEPVYSVFELDTILPNEIAFYYGALMFHYSHNNQAETSLLKYIKVSGKEGEYYEDALEILRLIHPYKKPKEYLPKEFVEEEVKDSEIAEEVDVPMGVEDGVPCEEGSEFAICPLCYGEGVKVSVGSFGKIYRTCPKCHGKGVVKCDDGKHE